MEDGKMLRTNWLKWLKGHHQLNQNQGKNCLAAQRKERNCLRKDARKLLQNIEQKTIDLDQYSFEWAIHQHQENPARQTQSYTGKNDILWVKCDSDIIDMGVTDFTSGISISMQNNKYQQKVWKLTSFDISRGCK